MDKQTIKSFIRWLEEATEDELDTRRGEIKAAFTKVASPEGKADVRLALRLVDEEVIARLELLNAQTTKTQQQA